MATVFDKILDTTTGPKSYDWYKNKVQSMTRQPGARSLINQGKADGQNISSKARSKLKAASVPIMVMIDKPL